MSKKNRIILFILLLILLSTFLLLIIIKKSAGKINAGFSLDGLNEFVIKDKFVPDYSAFKEEDIFANKGKEIIKIKTIFNFSKTQAEQYLKDQNLFFESAFEQKLPPYPEFLTNKTGCSKEFLPILKNGEYGNYYLTYADERLTYGLCANDLIKYKSGYGIFYCESSHKIFNIEYFVPSESSNFELINNFLKSFKCL